MILYNRTVSVAHLPRLTKLLYGIGDTGFSLTSTIVGVYFAIFLTDVVGVTPAVAAIAIFVGRTWDYINDPLVGYISDRTRTRWGRRRPYLLFGSIPFGLAFTLLWWRPPLEGTIPLAIYYAFVYVLFDTAATFAYMPFFALTPELTFDYDERTALSTYRMFFSILGSLVAFTVPLAIIGALVPENAPNVFRMGVIFAVISVLPLWLTFGGTRERKELMATTQPNLIKSLKAAVKNRPFVFSAMIFLFTWASMDILQATLLYFIKYGVKREAQSDLVMGVIFVTAIFALPFWQWVSKHWDKRLAYISGVAFWAVVQLTIVTLTPSTSLQIIIGLCLLAGIGVSAAHVLPWSIIPDAVEWDEWKTGERHEGVFYSLITLIQKIASSIAIPLTLMVLDVTGYIPNAPQQPPTAILGIRIAAGAIPALLLCMGILFAAAYPLRREEHAKLVQELSARRIRDL